MGESIFKQLLVRLKAWIKTVGFLKFLVFLVFSITLYAVAITPGGGKKGISLIILLLAYGFILWIINKVTKK